MEKAEAIIKIEVTKEGNGCEATTEVAGSVGLAMYGLAMVLIDIENTFPEEERAEFRTDFQAIVNDIRRKEATNVNT